MNWDSLTLHGVNPTGQEIGRGAYGRVFEVNYEGTLCAAKEIHALLLEYARGDDQQKIIDDFLSECQIWSTLRHPCIVQFLGVYYPPTDQFRLPVMVMEKMKYNLRGLVERYDNIPINVKLTILDEVCLGLRYLHSRNPPIVHRDLTPNNILLGYHLEAKITDLGVAKIVRSDNQNTMTKIPGTPDFMPPEALSIRPVYGPSLDVFSYGAVILNVTTQLWPQPTDLIEFDPDTGRRKVVSEVKRRQVYLDKMTRSAAHLKPLVISCLDDNPKNRPYVAEVSITIKKIKDVCSQLPGRDRMSTTEWWAEVNQLSADNEYLLSLSSLQLHETMTQESISGEDVQAAAVIKSKETCPLLNYNIQSKNVNHNGGALFIEDHMIFIQIPENAVNKDDTVEIKAAASYFGQYEIPDEYQPISAYLWVAANYKFKKQVKIIMPHYGAVFTEDDKSAISVLTASEDDKIKITEGQVVYKMHRDNSYDYEIEGAVCIFKVYHFCSDCLVKEKTKNLPNRIVALHYFPEDYVSVYNVQSEVCFCYDTEYCKTVVDNYFSTHGMKLKSTGDLVCVCDDQHMLHLTHSVRKDVVGWDVLTSPSNNISTTKVDFRLRYKKPEELLRDEARGIYPPRFVFNLCRKQYCTHLTVEFVINLKKGKKNHGKFKGNIFIENKDSPPPELPFLSLDALKNIDVFNKYYALLRNVIKDERDLFPVFVSAKLLSTGDLEEPISQRVDLFLRKIKYSLEQAKSKHFNMMLTIMEQHGTNFAKELAQNIRKQLNN